MSYSKEKLYVVAAFGVFVLFVFGLMMLAAFSNSVVKERVGDYASVLMALIVVAIIILAWWLWKNRSLMETDMARNDLSGVSLLTFGRSLGIRDAILNHIRMRLSLWGGGRVVIGREKDALLMKWVFEHEYVLKEDLAKAVHDRLCAIGREAYEWHVRAPIVNYPDHSASPEALGYAILHGVVSDEEAKRIRFDHGETAKEYRKMAEGLCEKVMEQLAAGTAFFQMSSLPSGDADSYCCCSH